MVPLPEYVQIKDTYCIRYLGEDEQIIFELELLKPIIEQKFGLSIRLVFGPTEERFAGVAEITDARSLEKFLIESDLPVPKLKDLPHI